MATKEVSLIAASCRNNGIGFKGTLPWRLKREMAYFTKVTSEVRDDSKRNAVIMGRKTWQAIPSKYRPLANRINVVLSKTITQKPDGCDFLFADLQQALNSMLENEHVENIFIIGGEQIYREAIANDLCRNIFLTRIDADYECDAFFPQFDENIYKQTQNTFVSADTDEENGVKYKLCLYARK
ncbi:hypothetical protein B4U79_02207 [Dinothrombium tinctorium]|uniref:dihydrofolate reductase n=1 Tax=Dinothrombium tinctorium TaxID=1965070 RepID=A0A443QFQ5_9ACAR|nr:hypothetical protein B4U79_02207 [Dinothrombium tinctorium]